MKAVCFQKKSRDAKRHGKRAICAADSRFPNAFGLRKSRVRGDNPQHYGQFKYLDRRKSVSRRKLREHLFKMVFLYAFNKKNEMQEQAELYLDGVENLEEEDRTFLLERFRAVEEKIPEIDTLLNSTAKGWKTNRFASCDLAILRVAVFEMKFDETIPDGVAINEAVELAKLYGGDESPSFVNGILGELSRK